MVWKFQDYLVLVSFFPTENVQFNYSGKVSYC